MPPPVEDLPTVSNAPGGRTERQVPRFARPQSRPADQSGVEAPWLRERRHVAGAVPKALLNAREKAASDS